MVVVHAGVTVRVKTKGVHMNTVVDVDVVVAHWTKTGGLGLD